MSMSCFLNIRPLGLVMSCLEDIVTYLKDIVPLDLDDACVELLSGTPCKFCRVKLSFFVKRH